ncbi:MAG: hypothetical protein K1X64_17150 [Myxococcaceae bacterium]|nr:hypothetical protein [Myxococcaceae bacterium]
MIRVGAALTAALAVGCGPAPQAKDEAAVVYRVSFDAEAGVSTKVVYPVPPGDFQAVLVAGLTVTDGATAAIENTTEGVGLALSGKGKVEASYSNKKAKGYFGTGDDAPDATLTMDVANAGTEQRYFRVNKGGSSVAPVTFEYTVSRDCGSGCGGTRAWTFSGSVGLGRQQVELKYAEETR